MLVTARADSEILSRIAFNPRLIFLLDEKLIDYSDQYLVPVCASRLIVRCFFDSTSVNLCGFDGLSTGIF